MKSLRDRSSSPLRSSSPQPEHTVTQSQHAGASSFQSNARRSPGVMEIIKQSPPVLNYNATVVQAFNDEVVRDDAHREQLNKMFIEIIISLHTWAMARPAFENEQASESFEAQISVLVAKEREQGRSPSSSPPVPVARPSLLEQARRRLARFLEVIQKAVLELTGSMTGL